MPSRPLPGLSARQARSLAERWNDDGLWEDIAWLADRFWSAPHDDATVPWHHLVMAVGNFKRQRGRRLHPAPLHDLRQTKKKRRVRFVIPGVTPHAEVHVDDPDTWALLSEALPGSGVATTTALLSALWPDHHVVFDWRVRAAANGLRLHAGMKLCPGVHPTQTDFGEATFDDYVRVRHWLFATAEQIGEPPVVVERALYELSRMIPNDSGLTWALYAAAIARALDATA